MGTCECDPPWWQHTDEDDYCTRCGKPLPDEAY